MNSSEGIDGPKPTFLKQGRQMIKKVAPWLYVHLFSHRHILEKLKRASRKSPLSVAQEKRLRYFIEHINTPENIDILEHICTMKTSKKYDIEGLLECFEKAESEEKIGPQFIIDTTLLFYNSPPDKKLSGEEKGAFRKLKNILVKRVPKVEAILPDVTQNSN